MVSTKKAGVGREEKKREREKPRRRWIIEVLTTESICTGLDGVINHDSD